MIINLITPIFGNISAPPGAAAYGGDFATGLLPFLNNIIRLIFLIAGLFAFFNLILGGLGFISAGGDPKAIEKAWGKIWQSLIGMIIIVSSFVLSAIFGYILFGSATAILNPKIYGPATTQQQKCLDTCPETVCKFIDPNSPECKKACQEYCAKFP